MHSARGSTAASLSYLHHHQSPALLWAQCCSPMRYGSPGVSGYKRIRAQAKLPDTAPDNCLNYARKEWGRTLQTLYRSNGSILAYLRTRDNGDMIGNRMISQVCCPHCGHPVVDNARTCGNCGVDLAIAAVLAEREIL